MERRFYVNKEDIRGDFLSLFGEEHHHLKNVLRLKEGDKVECFSSNSPLYVCQLKEISKDKTLLKIESSRHCTANPQVDVTLFQGLVKPEKFELITQKFCELGGSKIVPFSSQFTVAKATALKQERLSKIIISACKQCGRTHLLEVANAVKFEQLLPLLRGYDAVLFANEKENNHTLKTVLAHLSPSKIALVVGSEGGFSAEEIARLNQEKNVFSLSLGRRILRTETAAIALSACVFVAVEQ